MLETCATFNDTSEEATGFLIAAIAPEAGGKDRVIVRPDRAEMIADGIVAARVERVRTSHPLNISSAISRATV